MTSPHRGPEDGSKCQAAPMEHQVGPSAGRQGLPTGEDLDGAQSCRHTAEAGRTQARVPLPLPRPRRVPHLGTREEALGSMREHTWEHPPQGLMLTKWENQGPGRRRASLRVEPCFCFPIRTHGYRVLCNSPCTPAAVPTPPSSTPSPGHSANNRNAGDATLPSGPLLWVPETHSPAHCCPSC